MTLAPMNAEQANTVRYLETSTGHTFITGKAGTGKTHVLRHLQDRGRKKFLICAPTGIAALNAGGSTIHNLLALGTSTPADEFFDVNLARKNAKALEDLDALVVDEISMVSSDLMDSMDRVLRAMRGTSEPFGGLQIIMFGDIYQLPPVVNTEGSAYFHWFKYRSEWFFDAHVWKEDTFKTFELDTIHRQSDVAFKEILNAVRDGSVTAAQLHQINSVGFRPSEDKGILLASRRAAVAARNTKELSALKGKQHVYKARVNTGFGHNEPAERELKLKPGAHIMMLTNDRDSRWVNGTQGTVRNCWDESITVEIDGAPYNIERQAWVKAGTPPEDYPKAPKFWQLPVKLAWAVTIHKSQGLSLARAEIDLGTGAFSPGQTYVALSRVMDPEGLYLTQPLSLSDIQVDPNVKRFFSSIS